MTERLFVHVNFGPTLTHFQKDQNWSVMIYVDGIWVQTLTQSDFIRIARGPHNIRFVVACYDFDPPYGNGWSHDIVVGECDVHFTINIYYFTDAGAECLQGDLEIDPAKSKKKSGCYVATAVYGSYDCPQVWALRRFRDDSLGSSWYGRLFIHTYYAISPTLVKWFGEKEWFKKLWKKPLDSLVNKLIKSGYETTPYHDKEWRILK